MARPKNFSPTYRKHRNSARCWVNGRWIELGRFNSPESRAEFARVVAELAASPAAAIAPSTSPTVVQILAAFWQHAEEHYRHPDGTQTGELSGFRDSLRPLRKLYGHTPASHFGPLALKVVRQSMIDDGLTRKLINQRIGRIKRVFQEGQRGPDECRSRMNSKGIREITSPNSTIRRTKTFFSSLLKLNG